MKQEFGKLLVCMLTVSSIASCSNQEKQQQPLTNSEVKQQFSEHQAEFESVKTLLLSENLHGFTVTEDYTTLPKSFRLPPSTLESCKKLMKEIRADKVVRLGDTVRFRILFKESGSELDEKNIVFDPKREYLVPKQEPGLNRSIDDL